jgi:methionyl aminopeptidase
MIFIKDESEIAAMRESGQILAKVLQKAINSIRPGIATQEIAGIAKKEIEKYNAEAAFLNYDGFPSVICISVNDQVVHGLPGDYVIKAGDLVSLDLGIKYKGMITDAARTTLVDSQDKAKLKLLSTTQKALDAGIDAVKDGARTGDLGSAIQNVLEGDGYGVVRTLVGHGVGKQVHEEPDIPNYGLKGTGTVLKPGMTIAIEPMSTMGAYDVYTTADGWSIATKDGSLSAHFEDTVLVTINGAEILTRLA